MKPISRRVFLQQAGAAGAALTVSTGPAWAAVAGAAEPVVVALVGVAHIHTPGFANTLKGRADVKVKYVWDHDHTRGQRYAADLKATLVADEAEIWKDPEVKAAIVCSETNRHRALVLAGTKAKKHLFVEKPLGMTGAESREMAKTIEASGVLFTTGYFNRTLPAHLFLKEQVDKGNLGKISRVRASFCHDASLGGWLADWAWMTDPKIAGCGAFGDLGTHMLDILIWMMGDIEAVAADIKTVVARYGNCDDSGEALIRFKNGTTGTLAAGWVDVANPVTLLISGTEGHAVVFNDQLYFASAKVDGADGKKPWTALPPANPHPLDMFLDAVGGKTGLPLVTPREAAARVVVMEAMYRAATEKKWVKPE
jgi:predicted dehydrogenase